MKTSDFDYQLPRELIAQTPVEPRDKSRLMVLRRSDGSVGHHYFYEIASYLHSGDTVVLNNSRVIPARVLGQKSDSDTKVEILLLRRVDNSLWEILIRPGRKVGIGTKIRTTNESAGTVQEIIAEVIEHGEGGTRIIHLPDEGLLDKFGQVIRIHSDLVVYLVQGIYNFFIFHIPGVLQMIWSCIHRLSDI